MANYLVTDTELEGVADAIREKGGTEADLEWPNGFEDAIAAIPAGGGWEGTYTFTESADGGANVFTLLNSVLANFENKIFYIDKPLSEITVNNQVVAFENIITQSTVSNPIRRQNGQLQTFANHNAYLAIINAGDTFRYRQNMPDFD